MPGILRTGLLVALQVVLGAAAFAQAPVPGGDWVKKTPLPSPRNETALASLDGRIYVLGGSVRGQGQPFNEEYDPATDRWRSRAPMPRGLDHLGVAVLGGRIHTIGGFQRSVHAGAVESVFAYDPASDAWQALASLKAPRGSVGVTVLDGRIHAIGGRNLEGQVVATHEVLRSGDRDVERARAVAEGARSPGGGRGRREDPRHWRPFHQLGRSHRPARDLRSRKRHLDVGAAAADGAQRRRLHGLSGHGPGGGRRGACDRHISPERSIRSEQRQMDHARAAARGATRVRRRRARDAACSSPAARSSREPML